MEKMVVFMGEVTLPSGRPAGAPCAAISLGCLIIANFFHKYKAQSCGVVAGTAVYAVYPEKKDASGKSNCYPGPVGGQKWIFISANNLENPLKSVFLEDYDVISFGMRGDASMGEQIRCPKCGSFHVNVDVMQENAGSITTQRSKSQYKEKRHGCLWWVFTGWWWWIVDGLILIFAFVPRALIHIGRKRDYNGSSTNKSKTKNIIRYKTICVCQNCGYHWEK